MIPKNLKVLLVEDFDITLKMQILGLNSLGLDNIVTAENGKDAIEKLETEADIELIISDWNMPEMNGYEFLTHVRADKRYKDIPFIMATAQGEKAQTRKAIRSGADQFLVKPFSPQELLDSIESVFSSKNMETDRLPRHESAAGIIRKTDITVGHIQITDHLPLGILSHLIETEQVNPKYFELKTRCMSGWNPVQNALEKGEVDVAFILAPLAMDLFRFGSPIKLVLFAHKNGSICVHNRQQRDWQSLHDFLKSKVFFLPHTMSIHHMLADMFLSEIGLKLGPVGKAGVDVFFEVVPPVKMPDFLKQNPDACGFVVAEPLGTMAINSGVSELMFFSGELWQNHPCCVIAMREDFIEGHPDAVHEFVQMVVEAGRFIRQQPEISAQVAVRFLDSGGKLGLTSPLLESVLTQPGGITTDDLFPVIEDLDQIQRYMKEKMGMGTIIDLERFVDTRFAEAACGTGQSAARPSIIHGPEVIVANMTRRHAAEDRPEVSFSPKERSEEIFDITEDENSIHFLLSSDPNLVNRVIRKTKVFITLRGFKAFSGFNLILRELMSNAVEHGNKGDKKRKISCKIVQMRETLFKITVEDEGEGFDHSSLNMTMPDDNFQLRRRGYPFISAFSEEIVFNEKGNQVTVYHRMYKETCFDTRKTEDGAVIIHPSGDITGTDINPFRNLLKKLLEEGFLKFRFDFSEVRDIDSVGLSAFIVLSRMLLGRSGETELRIVSIAPDIASLFRMTHLDEVYSISEKKS